MKNKLIIILFIMTGLLLFTTLSYRIYLDYFNKEETKTKLDSIELYGYSLDDNDTELYKEIYETLRVTINSEEINYDTYSECISKLFLIDLFNLDNKLSSTDIQGLEYIYPELRDNFKEYIGNSLYSNIEINLDGNRVQELPKVKNVIINSNTKTNYTYNEKEYEGYLVNATIEYEKDLGYQSNIELTLIKDNDILYIVKGE